MYLKVLSQVVILFIVMFTGYYARYKKFFNETVIKGLSDLLLNITLPMLIISSFEMKYSEKLLKNSVYIVIFTAVSLFALIIISKLLFFKYPEDKKKILRFCMIFSNCGFMGYPVMESIMGKTGVFYASIAGISFNLIQFTIGIMIFTGEKDKKGIKNALLTPALISILIGIIIFVFSIKIPEIILKAMTQIGGMTTPLSMLIVGSVLYETKIKDIIKNLKIYYSAFTKLIISPLIAICIMKIFGASSTVIQVVAILVGMPTASITTIFAEKYGGDKSLSSQCIFLSTVLSLVTIPIMISIIL